MATFEFLRVSLVARDQGDLFAEKFDPADRPEKKRYLETVFEQDRWDFEHNNRRFSLVKEHRYGNTIVFRIGKHKLELGHGGPEQHFPLEYKEDWELAWAVFDMESDSQLFIIQTNIGSPRRIIESLFGAIETSNPTSPYEFAVEYVSEKSEFWSAAKEYKGKITRIEFSFLPPNALGMSETIKALVVSARTQLGAEKTAFVHTNPDGALHPDKDDEYTNSALDVVSDGGGSVTMKSGISVIYSSGKNKKTKSLGSDDLPENSDDKGAVKTMAEKLKDQEVSRKP